MHHVRLVAIYTFVFLCTAFTLFEMLDRNVYTSKYVLPLLWLPLVTAQNATVDLGWHAPKKSWINDLGQVLNGTGTNGFVFNGSQLPTGTPYGTYDWCNMPHVRAQEYPKASDEFELVYVEVYVLSTCALGERRLTTSLVSIAIIRGPHMHLTRSRKSHMNGTVMTKDYSIMVSL